MENDPWIPVHQVIIVNNLRRGWLGVWDAFLHAAFGHPRPLTPMKLVIEAHVQSSLTFRFVVADLKVRIDD